MLSHTVWIISILVLILLGAVIVFYMSASEEMGAVLKKKTNKEPVKKESPKGKEQKINKRKSVVQEKAHYDIIGPSKTDITDYVYTSEDELNDDNEEPNVSTPEELLKEGISSADLYEGDELWDSEEVFTETTPSNDYKIIANALFNQSLSSTNQDEVFTKIDDLKRSDFLRALRDFVTDSYQEKEGKINTLVMQRIQEAQTNLS